MFRRLLLPSVLLALACHHESDLPKLFPIPEAQLVSDAGKPVRMSEMKGHVVVYDFIFTHCAGTCPMMTATMRRLTKKIPKTAAVRFVSISVDPIRDTPKILHDFPDRRSKDDRRSVSQRLQARRRRFDRFAERVGAAQCEVRRRRQEGRDPRLLQRHK